MSPESPFEPGFDPAAHGFSPAPDPKVVKPRLQRPKLSPEERAERKAAKRAARGDNGGAHTRAAQAIVDPDEREATGRALYAEIGARKAILIAQRQALTDGPPYDVDKLNAELGARFNIEALVAEHYDSPGNREYRKARNAPGFACSDELDRLRREIDALSTEQIEISWAYASPATLAAFEAQRPAIEAAEAEAKRLHAEDIAVTLRQWQEEGARFVSIIDIPDPRKTGEIREGGAVPPFVRTGKLHLPASKLALGPEPESSLQKSLKAAVAEDAAAQIFADAEDDADRAPQMPQDGQVAPGRTSEAGEPPAVILEVQPPPPPPPPPELPPEPPQPEEPEQPEEPPEKSAEADDEAQSEEEPQWPDLTFTEARGILDLVIATRPAPNDPDQKAMAYEAQTTSAGARVWEQAKHAEHPERLKAAHASQDRYRAWFQTVLGPNAKSYNQTLTRLAASLHLRQEAEAELEEQGNEQYDPNSPLGEALTRFNEQWAVALIRNKVRVISVEAPPPRTPGDPSPPILTTLDKQSFFDLHDNVRAMKGSKQVKVAPRWFAWEGRRIYKRGIEFDPAHAGTRSGAERFNLFWGCTIKPAPGKALDPFAGEGWKKFRDHLLDNVCRGNHDAFVRLVCWYADLVQNPTKKKGTSLVLRGDQGVGKSKATDTFGRIFGPHHRVVDDLNAIAGSFNEHLVGILHLVMEEATWAGDKAAAAKIRQTITGESISINPKGVARFDVANHIHAVTIANADWVVDAPRDDRRHWVYDVGGEHRNDHPYFAAIDEEMLREGGDAAMLRDLMAIRLDAVRLSDGTLLNLRKPYVTKALIEQKERSMPTELAWLKDWLRDGEVEHPYDLMPNVFPIDGYMASYRGHAGRIGDRGRKADESAMGKMLVEVFGKELSKRTKVRTIKRIWNENGPVINADGSFLAVPVRIWCRKFPTLSRARKLFLQFYEGEGYADWFEDDPEQEWDVHPAPITQG